MAGMAGIDLEKAQRMLDLWLAAEEAIAITGQSYQVDLGAGRRNLTRADLGEVRNAINYWRRQVAKLTAGRTGPRIRYIVPRDS